MYCKDSIIYCWPGFNYENLTIFALWHVTYEIFFILHSQHQGELASCTLSTIHNIIVLTDFIRYTLLLKSLEELTEPPCMSYSLTYMGKGTRNMSVEDLLCVYNEGHYIFVSIPFQRDQTVIDTFVQLFSFNV